MQYWTLAFIKASLPSHRPFFPASASSLLCLPDTQVTLTQPPRDDFARQQDSLCSTPWEDVPLLFTPGTPRAARALCCRCIIPALTDNHSFHHQHGTRLLPLESYRLRFSTPLGDRIPMGPQIETSLLYASLPHTGAPKEWPCETLGLEIRVAWERRPHV